MTDESNIQKVNHENSDPYDRLLRGRTAIYRAGTGIDSCGPHRHPCLSPGDEVVGRISGRDISPQWTRHRSRPQAGSLPHSWLLHRCAALVHHGGFGSTAAGMRAGKPALVIPHIADQFFWANIVHDLGVGPQSIRRPELSVTTLATSLDELVHNDKLGAAAASLGEQIRTEKGIDNAVRQIEDVFH
ncbi:MAG: hypothetical protein MUO58_14925 [Anaerolineales bacterium]|nr:hypothetical protein [Anaerolineales bacterium]